MLKNLTCFGIAAYPYVIVSDFHVLYTLSKLLKVHGHYDIISFDVSVSETGNEIFIQNIGYFVGNCCIRYVGHVYKHSITLLGDLMNRNPRTFQCRGFYTSMHHRVLWRGYSDVV